uniref:Uncharacterized protein n=1 Tax=Pavo cristatus TaxID=9049 RepID=A0A8C9FS68_PAVCR
MATGPTGAEAVAATSGSAWRRWGAERAMPLVVLCGPPGSGKSRRAAELRDALGGADSTQTPSRFSNLSQVYFSILR